MTGEDGAKKGGTKDEHDSHGILGLSVTVHASDPSRERENAVAGNGEDKTGGGDDGDTGVLKER